MNTTVICHFWNNASILPWWLRLHTGLFRHGVLVDHGASDGSVELIREMAPHWEIRPTRRCTEWFDSAAADEEVMAIEAEFSGWKMVLNVTEFLVLGNLDAYLAALPAEVSGVTTSGVVMVDRPQDRGRALSDDPLFAQCNYGYFEYELGKRPEDYGFPAVWRSRLLHRHETGRYEVGRHVCGVPHVYDPALYLAWAGWAPFDLIKDMKMSVQQRIPPQDFARGRAVQHQVGSVDELEARLASEQARSHPLFDDVGYARAVGDALEAGANPAHRAGVGA